MCHSVAREIEYRYLVENDAWRDDLAGAVPHRIEQGYVFAEDHGNLRVRIIDDRDAVVTVKGARAGATRPEYEWAIPLEDARGMVADLCTRPPIVKTRWQLAGPWQGWELDEFGGENEGLVIAEREVGSEDEDFSRPPWLGREVTAERKYANADLQFAPQPRR